MEQSVARPGQRLHARSGSRRVGFRAEACRKCATQSLRSSPRREDWTFCGSCCIPEKGQTLIFTRTKRGAERLAKELVRDGFNAAMIHGDRSQSQRNGALHGFQEGRFQVLVATDIAARGLHIDDVAHVINYDLPKMAEDFIHRVGRTGRAGSEGCASTIVTAADIPDLRNIERTLQMRMERKQTDLSAVDSSRIRVVQNTLASRTLTALPGEVFI